MSGWNRKHPERRTQRRYIYYTCYGRRVHAGCDQPFFSEDRLEAEVLAVLGLAQERGLGAGGEAEDELRWWREEVGRCGEDAAAGRVAVVVGFNGGRRWLRKQQCPNLVRHGV